MLFFVLLNTIVPAVFSFGDWNRKDLYKDKALRWLEEIAAERNTITDQFAKSGIDIKNAMDSQSIIELKTVWCDQRKCLECAIGNALLKQNGS